MSLTAGARLGPYEIVAPLGAGGMGAVYRAKDTRLDREVAVKVLSSPVSADPQLRQRFEREARAISSLNHPNICALFDVGEVATPEPTPFLVMELVEGESLSERLTKGPLPLDEALQRGIEIADALSSAHRRGIIHRDVKPGNVMLTKAGAKLLDFGLAKSGPGSGSALQRRDRVTTATPPDLTAHGTILGTVQYMAPEQLEGLDLDARTDIFAFGALFFEMVTGRKAFAARTQASLIGAILKDQPPMVSSVITVTPAALDRVITKCLAKDPDHRWQDASDLRDELKWIAEGGSRRSMRPRLPRRVGGHVNGWLGRFSRRPRWHRRTLDAVLAARAGTICCSVHALATGRRGVCPTRCTRRTVSRRVAGRHPTRVRRSARRRAAPSLWVQSFDALDARPLNDTTVRPDSLSPALPFWSPDSRSVGFFADGKLKRVEVNGGSPQAICDAPQSGGASWGANDTIVFASKIDEGLRTVSANGGVSAPITTPDATRGEIAHSNPAFLPDGRHFLFWVQAPKSSIRVGLIGSSETKHLFEADSRALYASGHVFFVRQSTLFAQSFDTARLETSGAPMPISDDVRTFPLNGRSAFSASTNGVLVYRSGQRHGRPSACLVRSKREADRDRSRLDRDVQRHEPRPGRSPPHCRDRSWQRKRSLDDRSRAGNPIAHHVRCQERREPCAVAGRSTGRVRVRPERRQRSLPETHGRCRRRAGVGANPPCESTPPTGRVDGSASRCSMRCGSRISGLSSRIARRGPICRRSSGSRGGRLSPDERWMLYTSDEAGPNAIYVRPFPEANGGKWRVSGASVGNAPRWRADGKEIFYADESGRIIAVPVTLGKQSLELGLPQVLFESGGLGRAQYRGQPRWHPVPRAGAKRSQRR